ncbi:MAG: hydroxyacylglutathione hydrolase [Agarilytica sp.]
MLKVHAVPTFTDNYVWIIQAPDSSEVCVIDPGDAGPVIAYLKQQKLELVRIFITHSHFDHINGINEVLAYKNVPVYGPDCDAIPQVTCPQQEGATFTLFDADVTVWHLPGHLPEHLGYIVKHGHDTQVFSGDIMFSGGCGRIFEGTHQELKSSLDRLASLPNETLVYGTHEYTQSNLEFAKAVEPDNTAIDTRAKEVSTLRAAGAPTLPTNILTEKAINPFIRCDETGVITATANKLDHEPNDALEVFTALREWKNGF